MVDCCREKGSSTDAIMMRAIMLAAARFWVWMAWCDPVEKTEKNVKKPMTIRQNATISSIMEKPRGLPSPVKLP